MRQEKRLKEGREKLLGIQVRRPPGAAEGETASTKACTSPRCTQLGGDPRPVRDKLRAAENPMNKDGEGSMLPTLLPGAGAEPRDLPGRRNSDILLTEEPNWSRRSQEAHSRREGEDGQSWNQSLINARNVCSVNTTAEIIITDQRGRAGLQKYLFYNPSWALCSANVPSGCQFICSIKIQQNIKQEAPPWFPRRRLRSAVQTHAPALVQVHVGVAEQPPGHAPHVPRDLGGQLGGGHVQVGPHLGAGAHLGDVEAVLLTCRTEKSGEFGPSGSWSWGGWAWSPTLSVRHAVEEDPVVAAGAVFDEGHVVAGLDAEDGKQVQLVPGQNAGAPEVDVTVGDVQAGALVRAALRVRVHLRKRASAMGNYPEFHASRLNTPAAPVWGFQTLLKVMI